jgi:hypothetical protein
VIGPGLLDWIRTLFAFEVSFCKICGFFFLGLDDCEVPFC